jgi:hypothetical protein
MSAASGAFGARAGFNQSGGGYLMIVSSINMQLNTCVPGSGSGGATNPPVITAVVPTTVNNSIIINGNDIAPLFATGRAVKDMGKSVVSAGRVFRKIQALGGAAARTANGVTGGAETTTPAYPGYATYYIETGFEGQNGDTPLPRVARFL